MRRVVLDCNAVDPIADSPRAYGTLKAAVDAGNLEIAFPDTTLDEVAAIRDLQRRQHLLRILVSLGRLVPSGAAILGISKVGFCRISDESVEILQSGNPKHAHDLLIGATAHMDDCALITHDERLAARARELGVEVLTTRELLTEFGFQDDNGLAFTWTERRI
jgi:hypothetical protein